jgi:DNA repair protein RadC
MKEDKKLTVKELPLDDRPREKLLLRGSQSLSDATGYILQTGKKENLL